MKKAISISILLLLALFLLSTASFADSLDTINIQTNKEIVNPGDTVTIDIGFGTDLGSYTFDIAYDNNLFEYVSSEGGTINDTGDKVRIYYFDSSGGTNPRTSMSMTFKAKEGITTSNPTDFSITAEGLANNDASVQYDDITTPIVKNVIVEPQYVDYTIELEYTGDVIENVEKEMKILITSSMGRYYDHARLVAEATTPEGGTVKLLATDEQTLEHDIIQSGWGDASGYKIGGNVNQELLTRGLFTKQGNYNITLKLIDRDNSDSEIASKTFNVVVGAETTVQPGQTEPEQTEPEVTQPEQTPSEEQIGEGITNEVEELPSTLPKTGNNVLWISIFTLFITAGLLLINTKKHYKKH